MDLVAIANMLAAKLASSGADVAIRVVEAGARKPPRGEAQWERFYRLDRRRILAFEADPVEAERLRGVFAEDPDIDVADVGLGLTSGPARLHVTRNPKCSSLYPPDADVAKRFVGLEVMLPDREIDIEVRSLADVLRSRGWDRVDFAKLDIQGAELDVLKGAGSALDGILGLVVEVNFAKLYKGQPRFHHVAAFLEEAGFEFYRFVHLGGKPRRATRHDQMQTMWGDALFLRPPENEAGNRAARLAILAALYGALDLAEAAVERCADEATLAWFRGTICSAPRRRLGARVRGFLRHARSVVRA